MAISYTVKRTSIGFGDPLFQSATTLAVTNTQTNTLTAALSGTATTIGVSSGKWRFKVDPLTTATTVSSIVITASNGTTTENIFTGGPWTTNSRSINQTNEFITDLYMNTGVGFTNFTAVVVFGAAATATVDFEWFGSP